MTENEAFDEVYGRYKNLVLKAAHLYVNDLDTAEDITQDTFLALFKDMRVKGFGSVEAYTNLKSWLFTTAKHSALNYRKKAARTVSADEMKEAGVLEDPVRESLEEEYFCMESEKMCSRLHEDISAALMEKNPRWYEAVMMVGFLDISETEAAEILGMSRNAFYGMMHRARNWIHKNFNVEYEELKRF